MSVLEAKSCGAETVPELVTSPQTTLPVDTPPLVAVKVQSRLSQSSGPAEAAPVMVSVAPVSAPVAAKLAAVAAPEAVSVPVDTSPSVVKFPALAVLLMVRVLPVIPVAELSRPTLAAPLMLSELPDTAPVDDSAAPATVPVAVSAAQETAPEASTPVVKTSVQFTSLHSSWSQPTLPCAVSPSSVAEPVRASESASRSVTETDSPSKALALICMLYRSSVPAVCAHVVVVGRADVHHQVGGRAQPVPAAEGVASPRRQRVGAHDVPGEGAQGHGVALQLEASHREAGLQQHLAQGGQRDVVGPPVEELVLQQQRRGRRVLLRRVAGLQGCVQDLEAVDVHRSCRLVGQARCLEVRTKVQLRHSVWRHCEVHLGRAPGALVAHEAAVQFHGFAAKIRV